MKQFFKDKNRMLIIFLVVAVGLSVFGYALTVDNFTDYKPPNTLLLQWRDYLAPPLYNTPSANNAITDRPVWSAEYPYRAILLGAQKVNGSVAQQGHDAYYYVIYSKKPTTDLFTFRYVEGQRDSTSTPRKRGYIRAYFNWSTYYANDDIEIRYGWESSGVSSGTTDLIAPSQFGEIDFNNLGLSSSPNFYFGNNNRYFDFDFYYECAAEHEQNAYTLNVNGLRSVASVPYAYILKCDNHGSPAGSTSGGESSSGGGTSGGGKNTDGYGGSHAWGGGEYGGGINQKEINSIGDGGGYSSRPDMDLSVPDDWTKPHVDNYDDGITSEYKPDYPPYVPAEGDTGQNGEDWTLPSVDVNDDGVSGKISEYDEFKTEGNWGLIDFMK